MIKVSVSKPVVPVRARDETVEINTSAIKVAGGHDGSGESHPSHGHRACEIHPELIACSCRPGSQGKCVQGDSQMFRVSRQSSGICSIVGRVSPRLTLGDGRPVIFEAPDRALSSPRINPPRMAERGRTAKRQMASESPNYRNHAIVTFKSISPNPVDKSLRTQP